MHILLLLLLLILLLLIIIIIIPRTILLLPILLPCFLNGASTSCWAMASPLPAFRDNWVFTPSPIPGGLGASLLIRHLAHNLSGMNCPASSYAAVGIALVWYIQLPLCFERLRNLSLYHILETRKQFRIQNSNLRDRHVKMCMCSINLSTLMLKTKWLTRKWITVFRDVAKFRYFIVLLRYSQHGLSQTLVSQNIILAYMKLQFPNAELVRNASDPIFLHLILCQDKEEFQIINYCATRIWDSGFHGSKKFIQWPSG